MNARDINYVARSISELQPWLFPQWKAVRFPERVCYKFRRGSYHDCNSGNYNFNRLQQHNFRLRRKAALGAISDPPPVTSSINVGVRPPRWSHAGANLPLCLNVLLDTCVKYSEFTFEPAHTSATHVKRVHGHLNLELWTSLRRIRA